MSSEWPVAFLADVADVFTGFPFKGADYLSAGEGIRVVRGDNVTEHSLRWGEKEKCWANVTAGLQAYRLAVGDVVIGMDGSKVGKNFAAVTAADGECLLAQRVARIRAKPQFDQSFLQYSVCNSMFTAYVRAVHTGTSIPHISKSQIERFQIFYPPLHHQQRIGALLKLVDERIALLRDANSTLEAILQAIFKSWFVDFDPVHARQQGRLWEGMDEATATLFPDSFEGSDLGLVPRGWKVISLGEACTVTIGGLWGVDTQETTDLVPAISLRGVDLENLRLYGFASDAPVRWVKPLAMEKRRVSANEVLIASSGAGPCGRPLWAGANFESLYGMPVIFSNFVKRLVCRSPSTAIYIDRLLAEMRASREIWNFINGTSIPNLDDRLLLTTKKIVIPSDDVLAAFAQVARAIYNRLYSQQAQTLAALRDTLLPRLISGQLRLPDAESIIDEVAA